MPTFTRNDKFDPNHGYVRLRFGERGKVLETELNEFQKIVQDQVATIGKNLYSDGFISAPAMTYTGGVLTVPADTVVINGAFVKFIDNMTITAGANTTVYLAMWEQEVMHTTDTKRNGNLSGAPSIDNGIWDYDVNIETTRRVQRQIQLVLSNADATKSYIPVATINASSAMTDTRVKSQVLLANLSFQSSDVVAALGYTPVAPTRSVTAGAGLTGGGTLAADRSFAVSFGGTGAATTVARSDHNHDTAYVPLARTVTASTGLTGGGALSGNISLSVSFAGNGSASSAARSDHNHDGTYAKLTGGETFTGDTTVSKNSPSTTLDRPSGQTGQYAGLRATDAGALEGGLFWDYTNLKWVLTKDGFSTLQDIIHSGGGQSINGALTVTGAISEGGTSLVSKYAAIGRSVVAGTGLTGGGTLAADRTLSVSFGGTGVASTVARSDHNHDATYAPLAHNHDSAYAPLTRTISTGSGLTGGGDLTANRTLAVSFGGTGAAVTVARSDHNHDTAYAPLSRVNQNVNTNSIPTFVSIISSGGESMFTKSGGTYVDPHTGVSYAIKVSGGIATDVLRATGMIDVYGGIDVQASVVPSEAIGRLYANGVNGNLYYRDYNKYQIVSLETTGDITYYVRPDGDDANTGASPYPETAFRTIQRAIDAIPKKVNHTVIISLGAGTWTGGINIQGFTGKGVIQLKGAATATTTHNVTGQVTVARNSCRVEVVGLRVASLTTNHSFYSTNCSEVLFYCCQADSSSTYYNGFFVESGKVYISNSVVIGKTIAIYAHVNGEVFAQANTGSANIIAHQASYGGRIHVDGTTPGATTMLNTTDGGIVTKGSGAVNPWGDNTYAQRGIMRASIGTAHALAVNTYTKLLFNTVHQDYKSGFDTTNNRYVAKNDGWYLVTGSLSTGNGPTGTALQLYIYVNGNQESKIGSTVSSGQSGPLAIQGGTTLFIPAGSYVELYAYAQNNALTTNTGSTYTAFTVTQVA